MDEERINEDITRMEYIIDRRRGDNFFFLVIYGEMRGCRKE